jgi:hypothetical protein
MRNIQFSTRETDLKVILFTSFLISVVLAGFLPVLWLDSPMTIITPVLSFAFALFAWGLFKIVEPPFYGRVWVRSKVIGIPALWLLLFISFMILFCTIAGQFEVVRDEFEQEFNKPVL